MIVSICNETIDMSKVYRVGEIGGDSAWLRYTVYFIGGGTMEIYHERKYADNRDLLSMKRGEFIALWANTLNSEQSVQECDTSKAK